MKKRDLLAVIMGCGLQSHKELSSGINLSICYTVDGVYTIVDQVTR